MLSGFGVQSSALMLTSVLSDLTTEFAKKLLVAPPATVALVLLEERATPNAHLCRADIRERAGWAKGLFSGFRVHLSLALLVDLTTMSAKKFMFEPPQMSQWIPSAFSEASALIELTTRLATRRPRFGVDWFGEAWSTRAELFGREH